MADHLKIKKELREAGILIVEDDTLICTLIVDVLRAMEFKNIKVCRRAEEGLVEYARTNYDLILCDWKLPGMSGLELTEKVRRFEKVEKCYTPVIMITGRALQEDVETARDMGVTEYLIKPFNVKSLCDKIKSIVENPRKFVFSDEYVGPDRRRRHMPDAIPEGVDRREEI